MEKKPIKFGIVGLGRGKGLIVDSLHDPDVQLTAICDRNPEKLQAAQEYFAKEQVTDLILCDNYDDLLKTDIDAVIIATDAVCHVPYAVQALEAGKHVLSEIPAVNSLEEAKLLKKAVSAHPELKYMTAENGCYLGFIQAWKKMYADGKFGDIVYAEAEYLHAPDPETFQDTSLDPDHWRTWNPAVKYCTHELGPLLHVMDDRCVSVCCMVPDAVYDPRKKAPYVENGVALFKTAKGAVIRMLICFGAYVGYTHNYALYGTKGMIEFDKSKPRLEAHCFAKFSDIPGTFRNKIEIPITCSSFGDGDGTHMGLDKKQLRAFLDCILNDTKPPIDVDLGIRMSLPGIYAHESYLQGGNAVTIPDVTDWD